MNEYRVEYSYAMPSGIRNYEDDTTLAATAQEAVDRVNGWYADLPNFRIEYVWIDHNNRWKITEAWS